MIPTPADVEETIAREVAWHADATGSQLYRDKRWADPEYVAKQRAGMLERIEEMKASPFWTTEYRFDPKGYPMVVQIVGVASGLRLRFFVDSTPEEIAAVNDLDFNRFKRDG